MPLNEADRAWIRQEIRTACERQGWWGKLTAFIRAYGATGAAVAILIFALTKWEAYVEFRTNTNNHFIEIEKTLGDIRGNLATQSLLNHSVLPLADFKATLPDLGSAIAAAQQHKVKLAPKVIDDLQKQFTASTDAPDFWPVAANFITYRSEIALHWGDLDLPTCTGPPDGPFGESEIPPLRQLPQFRYHNCKMILDLPDRLSELAAELSIADVLCDHCAILYNGGPVAFIPPRGLNNATIPIRGNMYFKECLFFFALKGVPPPEAQRLVRSILAATGNTIEWTGS